MKLVDTPRKAVTLVDRSDGSPLGEHPAAGHWVLGLHAPLLLWWRCPTCEGVVPIDHDEVNEEGLVFDSMTHTEGNAPGRPFCSWSDGLRLLDYDAEEHKQAQLQAVVSSARAQGVDLDVS